MSLIQKTAHLSKLAFFLALGVAATVIDACGGRGDDDDDKQPAKGGASASGQTGTATGAGTTANASGGSSNGSVNSSGGAPSTSTPAASGGAGLTIKTTTAVDAGPPPKDADLWDVICE